MSLPKGPQGANSEGTQPQPQPGDQIDPEDYRNPVVADFLTTHLPADIVYRNGHPEAATKSAPPPMEKVLTAEQAAREATEATFQALTKRPETFWPSITRLIHLGFLMDGIDSRAVRVSLPFNSTQVRDGGISVIKAVQTDHKAECMEVNVQELGQQVAASLRVGRAREALEPAFRVVDANETVALGNISTIVTNGLKLGESVIKGDGNLSWVLGPALAIRRDPVAEALASRLQNARTEDAIRSDEKTRLQAGPLADAMVAPTTTLTAQTALPTAPSAARAPYAPAPKK